jgi:hypothetical protein
MAADNGNLSMSDDLVGMNAYVMQYQYCVLVSKDVFFFKQIGEVHHGQKAISVRASRTNMIKWRNGTGNISSTAGTHRKTSKRMGDCPSGCMGTGSPLAFSCSYSTKVRLGFPFTQ